MSQPIEGINTETFSNFIEERHLQEILFNLYHAILTSEIKLDILNQIESQEKITLCIFTNFDADKEMCGGFDITLLNEEIIEEQEKLVQAFDEESASREEKQTNEKKKAFLTLFKEAYKSYQMDIAKEGPPSKDSIDVILLYIMKKENGELANIAIDVFNVPQEVSKYIKEKVQKIIEVNAEKE